MCGRYLRKSDKQRIAEAFRVANDLSEMVLPEWDYNVAPTTWQPVIRVEPEGGERELVLMRWGLVPWFARSLKDFGFSTINAKAETLTTSRMWQGPLERRRCLVPADGFYEWKVLPAAVETDLFTPGSSRWRGMAPTSNSTVTNTAAPRSIRAVGNRIMPGRCVSIPNAACSGPVRCWADRCR